MSYNAAWWESDEYLVDTGMPVDIEANAGPMGPALVKAWPDGRTDPGWGLVGPVLDGVQLEGFMPRYKKNVFNARRAIYGYNRGKWAFAFVMRSLRLVCIDIDGKNGGIEGAKRLGPLPKTLAETSKSGTGYHLYYLTDEEWDEDTGFGVLGDRIGIEQGVDVRATGCVYHHPQQRWNTRQPAMLPEFLKELLLHRDQKIAAQNERIASVLESNDEVEILMMQDQMEADLAKPIPAGKRNNTLFAIGSQMHLGAVPNWEDKVRLRAHQVGLDELEQDKLINNIKRYGTI